MAQPKRRSYLGIQLRNTSFQSFPHSRYTEFRHRGRLHRDAILGASAWAWATALSRQGGVVVEDQPDGEAEVFFEHDL